MEYTVNNPIADKRLGELIFKEMQAITFDFFTRHAKRWGKLSEQTMHGIRRDFPYTEEAKHMVYAVSIKVLIHILEATYPPLTAVFHHFIPVIRGKSPVLSVHREVVRRCTGLSVEVEILRFHPHIAAISIDANRDIAFQNDAFLTCIGMNSLHLLVQNKLHEIEEFHFFIFF